jgi:hypothetical protein
LASAPVESTLTRSVTPVVRSWTNTSLFLFVSPETRLVASLLNATNRWSAEIVGTVLSAFPSVPDELTLTRSVRPLVRSCTKTSRRPFESPETRFEA